jgi:hypothetical protein
METVDLASKAKTFLSLVKIRPVMIISPQITKLFNSFQKAFHPEIIKQLCRGLKIYFVLLSEV